MRFSAGVDLLLKLDERFESEEYRTKRRAAAIAFQTDTNLDRVEDVLDFFETLGLLVRRKALDPEIVRNALTVF